MGIFHTSRLLLRSEAIQPEPDNHIQDKYNSSWTPKYRGRHARLPAPISRAGRLIESSCRAVRIIGAECIGIGIVDPNTPIGIYLRRQAFRLRSLQELRGLARVVRFAGSAEVCTMACEVIRQRARVAPILSRAEFKGVCAFCGE